MIAYRNGSEVLTLGDCKAVNRLPKEIIGYTRTYKNESVLVFHNVSNQEVSLSLEDDFIFYNMLDLITSQGATISEYLLTMPAYSTVIIKKQKSQ
jgi:hypothetical protein